MDGQLVKSCILSGAPYISTEESLYVSPKVGNSGAAGGFNGYLSNLQYIFIQNRQYYIFFCIYNFFISIFNYANFKETN